MSDQSSELVEISKLNGDFKKNYGKLIGGYLYLRSVSAARGRPYFRFAFRGLFNRADLVEGRLVLVVRAMIDPNSPSAVSKRRELVQSFCTLYGNLSSRLVREPPHFVHALGQIVSHG